MYILIDTIYDGLIVDNKFDPRDLDLELVRQRTRWDVGFRTEPELNAGGSVTIIASVDYSRYSPENHDWVAQLVAEVLGSAYEDGWLESYCGERLLVTIGGG